MKLLRIVVPVVALFVLVATDAGGQEKIDNPEFVGWSKHKPGTTVTLKSSIMAGDAKSESTVKTTLVEVGTDKLVVEVAVTSSVNGMEFKAPPMKRDVPKTIALPAGAPNPKLDPTKKPEGTVEEGTETLKVGGADYKTKWYRTKNTAAGNTTEAKVWMSDEVPGGMVKMEANTTGTTASTIKMELVEFKKP